MRPPARLAFTPDWPYRFVNGQTITVHRLRIGGAFVDARPVHAGGFSFGRRPTLCSETLRIPDRLRTAVTVRLSLSAISADGFSGFCHFPQLLFLPVAFVARILPLGIADRGPFIRGRIIDLSVRAARALGMMQAEVGSSPSRQTKEGYRDGAGDRTVPLERFALGLIAGVGR
jgi:hypothetical protein